MPRLGLGKCWPRKEPGPDDDAASSELLALPRGPGQQPEPQPPGGRPSGWRKHWRRVRRKFHRRGEPEEAGHPEGGSADVLQLVQEGQFREACLGIWSSAQDGQDCSSQYQAVAQGMWQVVRQALGDVGHSKELTRKLRSVEDAVTWAWDTLQDTEDTEDAALRAGGAAAWGRQLEGLLRSDAEARVPAWDPGSQLGPYLEDLDKAVAQRLGPQGAGRLGPLQGVYTVCFQEVLLSRLFEVLSSCHRWESCYRLYTWGQATLFGQRGETPLGAPGPSQTPEAESPLNQLVFVTWMSQVQKALVEMVQDALAERLEKVLIHACEHRGASPYPAFLDLLQLLEETINSVQHVGPPIAGRVQAMVLERFLKLVERYRAEATRFLQSADAAASSAMHVLQNGHILRETWQELSQEYAASAALDRAVRDTIDAIEGLGRGHLLSGVRVLCQSLLRDHFGKKDRDLARALRPLQRDLADWSGRRPTPLREGLVESLSVAVFGEYVQALVSHLRTQEPRKWGHLQDQVDTDTRSLHGVFGEHGGPRLAELRESVMEFFLPGEVRASQALDSWLASLGDRFPGFLRQDKTHSFEVLEAEVEVTRHPCCRCC